MLGLNLYAQQPQPIQAPKSGNGSAQAARAAADQQPDSENDIDMQDWINNGNKTVERLVSLGVERKVAESFVSDQEIDGSLWVRWQTARAGAQMRLGILFLPCHLPDDGADLFALARQGGAWHVTDHAEFDCHYDDSVSIDIQQIRFADRDEVLVHHACEGRGTGFLQQDFQLYLPFQGKLRLELDAQEVLNSFPPPDMGRDLKQRSTFTVIPIRDSSSRAIEEIRSSISGDRLTVQERIYRWDEKKWKYIPSKFTVIEAPPS